VHEANARVFLDERTLWPNGQFVTTELVASTKFLQSHPDLVKKWLRAQVELTDWINGNVSQAKQIVNQQILKETGKALSAGILDDSFSHLQATYDPLRVPLMRAAQLAFDGGFLGRTMPDLSRLYDLTLLNEVLTEKGKKPVQ
jgi:NitT/TauT family transport system substrate-binding protein